MKKAPFHSDSIRSYQHSLKSGEEAEDSNGHVEVAGNESFWHKLSSISRSRKVMIVLAVAVMIVFGYSGSLLRSSSVTGSIRGDLFAAKSKKNKHRHKHQSNDDDDEIEDESSKHGKKHGKKHKKKNKGKKGKEEEEEEEPNPALDEPTEVPALSNITETVNDMVAVDIPQPTGESPIPPEAGDAGDTVTVDIPQPTGELPIPPETADAGEIESVRQDIEATTESVIDAVSALEEKANQLVAAYTKASSVSEESPENGEMSMSLTEARRQIEDVEERLEVLMKILSSQNSTRV